MSRYFKKLAGFLLLFLYLTVHAGIHRHDRDRSEHLRLAKQAKFDCVGQIYKDNATGASCVLIGKNMVLSAAHCFYENGKPIDTKRYKFCFKGQKFSAKRIVVHEKYKGQYYDICFIELNQPVEEVTPATICETFDELHSVGIGVGYGYMCRADQPDEEGKPTVEGKFAGENTVDSIGGASVEGSASVLYADFDCPKNCKYYGQCNKMGNSIPLELEFCTNSGDSGGGLFRNGKNGLQVIGIVRGGGVEISQFMKTFYYGQVIEWTRVSAFSKWIKQNSSEKL